MHAIIMLSRVATLGALALTALGATGCYAGAYDDPAYYPSDGFVATEDPVYYDGQATYFYGGLWYYRSGGSWSYYRSEPGYLRDYRVAHPGILARGGARGGGARRGVRGGARGGGVVRGGGGGHGGRR
jgi:hypothetical protein